MRVAKRPYTTNFYLWNGVSAFFFSSCLTNTHSHNTMQIIVDIQDNFRCRIKDGDWKVYKNLIIRENVIHQLDTLQSVQLLIYLDTETAIAKEIRSRHLDQKEVAEPDLDIFHFVRPDELQQALLKANPDLLLSVVNQVLKSLAGPNDKRPSDDRIATVEKLIATRHPSGLTPDWLAAKVYLSESRMRSLFKQSTGVSLHKYIMYSKIRFAINRIMAGSAVQEAAYEAGFTDSSHFHKMMVRMFGMSPSQFMKDNQRLTIVPCDRSPLNFETSVYNEQGIVEKVYK